MRYSYVEHNFFSWALIDMDQIIFNRQSSQLSVQSNIHIPEPIVLSSYWNHGVQHIDQCH